MIRWKPLLASTIAAVMVGCTVGPNYAPPEVTMPDQFSEASAALESTTRPSTMPATTQVVIRATDMWWKNFKDPQLDSIIERAVSSNLDLKAAESRIRQARAQYGIAVSAEYPLVTGTGAVTRSRSSTLNRSTVAGSTLSVAPYNLYQAGFDASWEIDVFGGGRRNIEASRGDIQAAVEDRRNVLLTLVSEVAKDYIDYRGYAKQIQIAQDNGKAQKDTLEVTRRQFEAGLKTATELDVANALALVATTESAIPTLQISLSQTSHALGILLGKEPNALVAELTTSKPIPSTEIPEIPIGLPSDLLRHRPDIRRSERQLAAATARIGVAVATLFPQFSLTGSLGLESSNFKGIGNYGSRFWSIGPSVSWPIFDFGKIRSTIRVQNALQEQALIVYEQTVLTALQDVEDSLVSYGREQVRRKSLKEAVDANMRAVSLARQRYEAGLTDFLNVLEAERALYAVQDQLVQSDRMVSEDLIAVYKALGGGWEVLEPRIPVQPRAK